MLCELFPSSIVRVGLYKPRCGWEVGMVRGDCEVERGISFSVFLSFSSNFVISHFYVWGLFLEDCAGFFASRLHFQENRV